MVSTQAILVLVGMLPSSIFTEKRYLPRIIMSLYRIIDNNQRNNDAKMARPEGYNDGWKLNLQVDTRDQKVDMAHRIIISRTY